MFRKVNSFATFPKDILPRHYSIALKIDSLRSSFDGTASIDVVVKCTTNVIHLNAAGLKIESVVFRSDDLEPLQKPSFECDNDAQVLAIKFLKPLSAGTTGCLKVEFEGSPNSKAFNRDIYTSPKGSTVYEFRSNLAVVKARRCFPCCDDPEYEATFDLTLLLSKSFSASFITPVQKILSDDEFDTFIFRRTPQVSPNLLSIVVRITVEPTPKLLIEDKTHLAE